MTDLKHAALACAALGLPVFPCSQNKAPLTSNWPPKMQPRTLPLLKVGGTSGPAH